jgi:endo-1,4-beta-D-glucanase Y
MARQRTQLALNAAVRWRAVRGKSVLRGVVVLGVMIAACLEGGCRTEQSWPLWESYAHSAFDDSGRIVDHSAGERTTSEGQAYGMFFALVANDRARFVKLLNWTQDNLAGGDLAARLPAWSWGKAADGSWKILDRNPASDADLWMAYALLEAGRLWHEPRYEQLGTAMVSHIAQQEVVLVPHLGTTLLPGPEGFHPDEGTWILNPSYLQPSVLSYLATRFPQGPWGAVLASLPLILTQGSGGGFAMDWVTAGGSLGPAVSPATPEAGEKPGRAEGSYDAIRVYLWLGIADPETQGVRESLAGLHGMATYMKHSAVPPRVVDESGSVTKADGPVGFSAAVVPYLHALNMKVEEKIQMDRVTAMRNPSSGLYGPDALYYDQNLVLFANGWVEERMRFERLGRLKVKWR